MFYGTASEILTVLGARGLAGEQLTYGEINARSCYSMWNCL